MADKKIDYLIDYLLNERGYEKNIDIPKDENEKFDLYRSLVNTRPPMKADKEYIEAENDFLKETTFKKGIVDISELKPVEDNIYIWKGDITRLKCGAIVNAANSQMTGCYYPCHNCIDNCIHTFSGIQLRYKCASIMKSQGHDEPTGSAKITPAYNLPCDFVIHTVGPIVRGKLTLENEKMLAKCYNSCLDVAFENNIKSIAFCCISTGVFGYPQKEAAKTAIDTVRRYLTSHNIEVIFNVFTEKDYKIYSELLG